MAAMHGRALPPLPGEELPLTAIDFLMPTGGVIPMQVSPRATLRKIKEDLYLEAKKYPLFTLLKDQGFYNFLGGFGGRIEPISSISGVLEVYYAVLCCVSLCETVLNGAGVAQGFCLYRV